MEFRSLFMTVIVGELAFKMRKANGSNELAAVIEIVLAL
jgi:hypothetical protein